jgi:hypothetical protein
MDVGRVCRSTLEARSVPSANEPTCLASTLLTLPPRARSAEPPGLGVRRLRAGLTKYGSRSRPRGPRGAPAWVRLGLLVDRALLEFMVGRLLPRFASSDRSMAIAPSSSASCSLRIDEMEGARWIPPSKPPHGRTSVRSAGSLLIGSTSTNRQRSISVRPAARSKDHHELPVPSRGSSPTRRIEMGTYTYRSPQTGKPVARHPEKRSCLAEGCSTRLSIYNPSQSCWLHETVAPKRFSSPKRS